MTFSVSARTVIINSDPPGLDIYVDDEMVGTAPVSIDIGMSDAIEIVAKGKGVNNAQLTLTPPFDYNEITIVAGVKPKTNYWATSLGMMAGMVFTVLGVLAYAGLKSLF